MHTDETIGRGNADMPDDTSRITRLEERQANESKHLHESLNRIEAKLDLVIEDREDKRRECSDHQQKTATNDIRLCQIENKITCQNTWIGGLVAAIILMVIKYYAKL